jgi:16S rRNA (guanine527-N7)-methyltransferase
MQEIFKKYHIELEKEELDKFEKFLEIFKEKNSQINLSAIREDQDIIEKHFIDSIILNTFMDFEENALPDSPTVEVADL